MFYPRTHHWNFFIAIEVFLLENSLPWPYVHDDQWLPNIQKLGDMMIVNCHLIWITQSTLHEQF